MTLLNILVLALLRSFTELLPISSSARLILVPAVTGWPDQGLTVDVSLHLGTFPAIGADGNHDQLIARPQGGVRAA